jgi:hypothetical protein
MPQHSPALKATGYLAPDPIPQRTWAIYRTTASLPWSTQPATLRE